MRFKIQWSRKREEMSWYGRRENEIIGHSRYTGALFLTHPVLLEKSRWDNSNHILNTIKRDCNWLGFLFGIDLGLIAILFGGFSMYS